MILKPAIDVPIESFIKTLNHAYSDYFTDIIMTETSMDMMIRSNGIDMGSSVVAIIDDRIVGISMLAIRGTEGWVSGVGVIPGFRGQGIGRAMMAYLTDRAREAGLRHLTLEVIEENKRALKLYESLGYKVVRRLQILNRAAAPATQPDDFLLDTMDSYEALAVYRAYHPTPNPWQRSQETLESFIFGTEAWKITTIDNRHHILAFCIGQVGYDLIHFLDIGHDPDYPDPDALIFNLFASIHAELPEYGATIMNHVESHAGTDALLRLGYIETLAQKEMVLEL